MFGVPPRIGKLQLAIGQPVRIGETRKPSDCFPAFRPVLLSVLAPKQIEIHTNARSKSPLIVPPERKTGVRKELRMQRWLLARRSLSPTAVRDWLQ